jgi:hypothetical protein
VVEPDRPPGPVAGFFTLAGSGVADPPRYGFAQRRRAAAASARAVLDAAGA